MDQEPGNPGMVILAVIGLADPVSPLVIQEKKITNMQNAGPISIDLDLSKETA